MKIYIATVALIGMLSACGFSSKPPEGDYGANSTYMTSETFKVVIISKRKVAVSSNNNTGKILGAVVGAGLGSSVSGSKRSQQYVGITAGGVIGSIVGEAVEKGSNKYFSYEYVVEKEDGELQAIVVNDDSFNKSDKAYLIIADRPVLTKR